MKYIVLYYQNYQKSVFCKHATNHRITAFGITWIDIYFYWVIYQHSHILLLGQKKMNEWRGYKESESCSLTWIYLVCFLPLQFAERLSELVHRPLHSVCSRHWASMSTYTHNQTQHAFLYTNSVIISSCH